MQLLPGQCKALQSLTQTKQISHTKIQNPLAGHSSFAQGQNQLPRKFQVPDVCNSRFGKGVAIPHKARLPALPSSFSHCPGSRSIPKTYFCKAAPLIPECLETGTVPIALNLAFVINLPFQATGKLILFQVTDKELCLHSGTLSSGGNGKSQSQEMRD